jgi:hypothetical protein
VESSLLFLNSTDLNANLIFKTSQKHPE